MLSWKSRIVAHPLAQLVVGQQGRFGRYALSLSPGMNKITKLSMNDPCCRVRIIFAIVRNGSWIHSQMSYRC